MRFQTDSDGSFDYKDVPAGDYVLFAVEDTSFEYANPAAVGVEPRRSSSQRLTVVAADAK
jgi:hypothetical protein